VIPVERDQKAAAEGKQQALLDELRVDLVVLARYMQILSPHLLSAGRDASSTYTTRSCPPLQARDLTTRPSNAG